MLLVFIMIPLPQYNHKYNNTIHTIYRKEHSRKTSRSSKHVYTDWTDKFWNMNQLIKHVGL